MSGRLHGSACLANRSPLPLVITPPTKVKGEEYERGGYLTSITWHDNATDCRRNACNHSRDQGRADASPGVAPPEQTTECAIAKNALHHEGKQNAESSTRNAEPTDQPEIGRDR